MHNAGKHFLNCNLRAKERTIRNHSSIYMNIYEYKAHGGNVWQAHIFTYMYGYGLIAIHLCMT